MPRNIEDMVVPERKRSIRNIPIPSRGRTLSLKNSSRKKVGKSTKFDELNELIEEERIGDNASPPSSLPPRFEMPPRPGASRRKAWLITGVSLVALVFVSLSVFSKATLSYLPRSVVVNFVDDVYTANKNNNTKLLYSVVKISGEEGLSIPASGEEKVERKASGSITVYNNATVESQRLIENTRFESPDGKIYRIQNAITIPGKVGSTPGSLTVTVYADESGEEFNIPLVDFTVPGLKGTSRYTTIYARSQSSMSGGFVGVEKVVSAKDLANAKSELQTLLHERLLSRAQAEAPSDFILFPSLSTLVYEELIQAGSENANMANVNLKGTLYGVMFKRSDLARELSKSQANVSPEERVELKSYEVLKLSFVGETPANLLSLEEINFKVNGSTRLIWQTDEAALKSDLTGLSKKEVPNILKNYPTISSASATIRPFWKSSFPEEPSKISIKKMKTE